MNLLQNHRANYTQTWYKTSLWREFKSFQLKGHSYFQREMEMLWPFPHISLLFYLDLLLPNSEWEIITLLLLSKFCLKFIIKCLLLGNVSQVSGVAHGPLFLFSRTSVKETIQHLLPMVPMDYLLLRSIMAALKYEQFNDIFDCVAVPPEILIASTAYFIKTSREVENKKEVLGMSKYFMKAKCRQIIFPSSLYLILRGFYPPL